MRKTVLIAIAALLATGAAPAPRTFRDCPDCPEMVVILAGRFVMGSPADEPGRAAEEGPQTEVRVARFALGRIDVTRAQWARFVAETGHADGKGCAYTTLPADQAGAGSWRNLGFAQGDDHPVVCVGWAEAQAYLAWLSARTGRRYRLPTEAEWEYAARAGSTTAYPWGPTASHEQANYGAETCCTGAVAGRDRWLYTSPAGAFPANRFGLSDMIGNAWQWVQDCWRPTLAGRPRNAAAVDGPDCAYRVARGGTWGDPPALIRTAFRNYAPPPGQPNPDYRSAGFGFRVATDELKRAGR